VKEEEFGALMHQDFKRDGYQYSTGIRNAMAIDWNHETNSLYFSTHGRDQLSQLWPEYFDDTYSSEFPSEEFHMASDGSNHGWPYTYWDHKNEVRLQGPEYGGDGKKISTNSEFKVPLAGLPGHWAPNDMIFYQGNDFPEKYKGGAFIGYHGSWNRAPLPQGGYKVVFFPFLGSERSGDWEVFADGFAGVDPLDSPSNAKLRPMGLAEAPDGALFITDSVKGRVWRVTFDEK
jgi:glucose/arabinose dehydrogenase